MQVTRVVGQKFSFNSTSNVLDLTLPATPTPGNYVIQVLGYYTSATITSVADTQGSPTTYTQAVTNTGQPPQTAIHYAKIPAGVSGAYTVRTTISSALTLSGTIQEVSGVAATSPLDTSGSGSGAAGGTTATATAAALTSQADAYAVAVTGVDSDQAITPGTGGSPAWAQVGEQEDGGIYSNHNMADRIPTAAATESETWTINNGGGWTACIAVFKAAADAGVTPFLRTQAYTRI